MEGKEEAKVMEERKQGEEEKHEEEKEQQNKDEPEEEQDAISRRGETAEKMKEKAEHITQARIHKLIKNDKNINRR